MSKDTRKVYSDIHGHLDPATVEDDEKCLILSNLTRGALLKLLGRQSHDSYKAHGLSDDETNAASRLYHLLQ